MNDSRPIVVGGCYRSGTSLVRRLLNSHPRIHCGPEVKLFRDFDANYIGVEDPIAHLRFIATARSLVPEDEVLDVLGAALVEMHVRAAQHAGKDRWADKTPENVVFLDRWQRILGDRWVFVHVVRNPLDTLASIKQWEFPRSIPAALDDRIDLYVEYAQAGLRFAEANPDRYLLVRYERLVADPEESVGALMRGLGEEFYPELLDFNAASHQGGLEDPTIAESRSIHAASVGRWRRDLDEAEGEAIMERAGPVWRQIEHRAAADLRLGFEQRA